MPQFCVPIMPPSIKTWYAQLWDRLTRRLRYRGSKRRRAAIARLRIHWREEDVQQAILDAENWNP